MIPVVMPTHFNAKEGEKWQEYKGDPFALGILLNHPLTSNYTRLGFERVTGVHALKFECGSEWDACNGFRNHPPRHLYHDDPD